MFEAKKPFQMLELSGSGGGMEKGPIEPEKHLAVQGRKSGIVIPNPVGRWKPDDVRAYGPKYQRLVKSVYHFFRKRSTCPANLSYRTGSLEHADSVADCTCDQRRSNLPLPARKRVIKAKRRVRRSPGLPS